MNNNYFAILDSDSEYAELFGSHLNRLNQLKNKFSVFTSLDTFEKFALTHQVDILFISLDFIDIDFSSYHILQLICLLEDTDYTLDNSKDILFMSRYNSPEFILKEAIRMLSVSASSPTSAAIDSYSSSIGKIIGVYSPIKRCGKTTASICIASRCSQLGSTLLITFDAFSWINSFKRRDDSGDFSDILYYFQNNKEIFTSRLLSISDSCAKFDFIHPPEFPEDIHNLSFSTFLELMSFLRSNTSYRYIVIDFGDLISPIHKFLSGCDFIYTPTWADSFSKEKIKHFLHSASIQGFTSIIDKFTYLEIPYNGLPSSILTFDFSLYSLDTYIDSLLTSSFYQLTSRVLNDLS